LNQIQRSFSQVAVVVDLIAVEPKAQAELVAVEQVQKPENQ
jgi:hypothetical protein